MDSSGFKSKISNFWYYNKVKVFFGLFLLIIFVYGIQSCIYAVRPDISIVFAGDFALSDDNETTFESEIEPFVDDINGDGKVSVALISLDLSGNISNMNSTVSKAMQDKMTVEITAGDSCIFILKKSIFDEYEKYSDFTLFENLKDITGIDSNYIPLSETVLGNTPYGKTLPEDMVIAFRSKVIFGTATESIFEASRNMLKKIIIK